MKSTTVADNPSKGQHDPKEAFAGEAKQFWYDLLAGQSDVTDGVDTLFSKYASYVPEAFKSTKRQMRRRCFELLRADAVDPSQRCGSLGRLVLMVGPQNLWFHTLHVADLGLPEFEFDAAASFDKTKLNLIRKRLKKLVCGPMLFVVEVAPDSGRVHVHLLADRDAVPFGLGRRSRVKNLLRAAAYMCKKPPKTRAVVAAYVMTARAGRLGRRQSFSGVTVKATVEQVEEALQLYVLKPKQQMWSVLAEARRCNPVSVPRPRVLKCSLFGQDFEAPHVSLERVQQQRIDYRANIRREFLDNLPTTTEKPSEAAELTAWGVSTLQFGVTIWEPSSAYLSNAPPHHLFGAIHSFINA